MSDENRATRTSVLTDDPCSCFYLRRAARLVTRQYAEAMKPAGLKSGQFSVLAILYHQGPLTITELADRMGLERTSLSRSLRPMEKNDLVSISAEQSQRRRFIELTKNGHAVFENALPYWERAQQEFRQQLGSKEMLTLK